MRSFSAGIALGVCLAAQAAPTPLPAFPGAGGAGALSAGGRGGAVLKVTNLNDAGTGSLRAAVEATGPRIVVFDLSGTIALRSPLIIREPRITIAGQSAPGDGITLRDQPLIVAADDVVIRYLRSRLGDSSGVQDDALSVIRAAIDPAGAYFDFRNNVFYNWGGDASGYNADTKSQAAYNFIGNAYVTGPDSGKPFAFKESNPLARAWFAGNAMNGEVPVDPWTLVTGTGIRLTAPLQMPAAATDAWDVAYRRVLDAAGASKTRDAVDQRIVAGVISRTHRIIDSQRDVGGWPALRSEVAAKDRDGDGMPDAWETSAGLNPRDAADAARDRDGDGYTNVEEYLNSLVER